MKKFYFLLLCSFFLVCGSFAQTLINPVTGGGFDNGTTFAANGWTVVNSSANKWVVGTKTSFGPPNSAYISIDGDPNNYSYDNTTAHISHFYQQVTIPANAFNVSLSYWLKGNVENDADLNVMDGLLLYADATLTVPLADMLPGPGADFLLPQFSSNSDYTQQTYNLSSYAGKTIFIIFTWVNNADGIGTDPPASIDDASLTYCIKAADNAVTGGGTFCTGSSGVGIGLAGSDIGISYQLFNNGNPVGDPVDGTGSPLDFGPQNVPGNYTIVGTSACNYTYPMPGSATVTENPIPVATAGSNAPVCFGSTLNLASGGGTTYSWTGPNGFTSSDQNPSITNFTATDAGTYTVIVTSNGCSAPATVTVTVTAGGAVGGTIASVSICSSASGLLTLTASSDNPSRWESSTDSTSVLWTSIPNTNLTQSFTGLTVPTFYRAVISNGCGSANSSIATVAIHNYWIGADVTNPTDWNTAANWSDNLVPSTLCPDVYIPNTPNKPILSGAPVATITNLHIFAGAKVTVNGTGLLQIGGIITNAGLLDVTAGTLELNGSSAQTVDGNTFVANTIKNLTISNNVTVNVTGLNDTLKISGQLGFGTVSGKTFDAAANNVTLLSTINGTASVGQILNTNAISGTNFTVERYIATGIGSAPNHGKSWQLLATPTKGQSINASWQEGATAPLIPNGNTPATNPHPGYGTMLIGGFSNAVSQGFDAYTGTGPSIKTYNYLTNGYDNGPSGTANQLYNQKGYIVLVRGNRSVYTSGGAATPTVLRSTGTLFSPLGNLPPLTNVAADKFESIGNPYASAVDIRNISKTGGVDEFFFVWDPRLGGKLNLGGFQEFLKINPADPNSDYEVQPGGGSYPPFGTPYHNLQSGQAFLVQTTGATGTVSFDETAKISGSALLFTPNQPPQTQRQLRSSLYTVAGDGSTSLADGTLSQFNDNYSNAIDGLDARKNGNTGENLSIKTAGKLLAIERKHTIAQNDTIFLNLTGTRLLNYRFEFTATDLDKPTLDGNGGNLQGFVEDTYLHTITPLNLSGTTLVNFTIVNIPGSYAPDRFRIVFAPVKVLPVTFTSVKAYRQAASINVEWKVSNEFNIKQYEVEKSGNGMSFTTLAVKAPVNNQGAAASYYTADSKPADAYNYYRIRSVDVDGKVQYTSVVKVFMGLGKPEIIIVPNPIVDGIIHLHLINEPAGQYAIRLLNKLGQTIMAKQITRDEGTTTELIKWDYNLAHGMYQLEITLPGGNKKNLNVLY